MSPEYSAMPAARRLMAARARSPSMMLKVSTAVARKTSAVSSSAGPSAKNSARIPGLSIA